MPTIQELLDLRGRVAIVTGGATHLGRAMATALGELGASVVIASRRKDLCEEVAAELRDTGIDCIGLGCDVTVEEEVDAMVRTVVEERGGLHVMVCNAGGTFSPTYIPNASVQRFMDTLDLNVKSAYMCAQAAARVMIPQQAGSIITIGSIHGGLGSDKRFYEGSGFKRSGPPYMTSKGAVIQLTRTLATELGEHSITVNCISPGQIPKPEHPKEFVERSRRKVPLERVGVADDLKGAVALLASPAGAWITGQNLIVDGGFTIW